MVFVAAGALAFAVALAITPVIRAFALRHGYVARARGDRWHSEPTPYLGGVAIFVGFAIALAAGFAVVSPAGLVDPQIWPEPTGWRPLIALAAAGGMMFVAGLWDDVRPLRPATKLLAQLIAGAVLISGGVMVRLFGVLPVDVVISLFWFVGITNAMNLLDNMDGLATGVVAIASVFLGVVFVLDGLSPFALVAFTLAGASIGFLRHNAHPARIFMGDSGSLFLGIFLAGLALAPAPGLSRGLFGVLAVPLLVLAVPILDTTLVTAGRIAEGRPIARGGRDHASHRLVALGLPEKEAVRVLWLLAAAGGAMGVLLRTRERAYAYLVGGMLLVGLALLGAFLLRVGLRGATVEARSTRLQRLLNWMIERPVLAFVLDVALFVIAYYGAYLLRWESAAFDRELTYLRQSLPLLVVAKSAAFVAAGVYRTDWRFFGLPAFGRLLRGTVLGSLLFVTLAVFLLGPGLSRGAVIIDWVLLSVLAGIARLSFRLFDAARRQLDRNALPTLVVCRGADVPVVFTHLRTRSEPAMLPVAFVDLEEDARDGSIMGVPRYAGAEALARAVNERKPGALLVASDGGSAVFESVVRLPAVRGLPSYRLGFELEQFALPLQVEDATIKPSGPHQAPEDFATPH